jgi:hypothetical protein
MRAGRDGGVVQLPPVQQRRRVLADVETVEGWSWCGENAVSLQLREYPWNEAVHMERDDVEEALDLLLRGREWPRTVAHTEQVTKMYCNDFARAVSANIYVTPDDVKLGYP